MDRHRFDADPNPDSTFHFDADADPDPDPDPTLLLMDHLNFFTAIFIFLIGVMLYVSQFLVFCTAY